MSKSLSTRNYKRLQAFFVFLASFTKYVRQPARHISGQGRIEVYFFVTDPIFLPKNLNPDPKNDENFDP